MLTAVMLEQRRAALRHANEIRCQCAALKRDVRAGGVLLADVLAEPPEFVLGVRVFDVLLWPAGHGSIAGRVPGDVMAGRMLAVAGVGAFRLVGELTERQRALLARVLREPSTYQQRLAAQLRRDAGRAGE